MLTAAVRYRMTDLAWEPERALTESQSNSVRSRRHKPDLPGGISRDGLAAADRARISESGSLVLTVAGVQARGGQPPALPYCPLPHHNRLDAWWPHRGASLASDRRDTKVPAFGPRLREAR
jgi:hypothetical protein